MKVIMDLCIIPLGVGVSVSKYIVACHKILDGAGLETNLHAYGTNIEGEWDAVFAAIKRCHETVHQMGGFKVQAKQAEPESPKLWRFIALQRYASRNLHPYLEKLLAVLDVWIACVADYNAGRAKTVGGN